MCNILGYLVLLQLLHIVSAINRNYNVQFRNTGLRLVIFKEKKIPKILQKFKNLYEMYYAKSIVTVGESIYEYNNNLSEEERTIIETLISLCY